MKGINGKSLPSGTLSKHQDGHLTLATAAGRRYDLQADGTLRSIHFQDKSATFRANGRIASIHTPTLDLHQHISGGRTIRTQLTNGNVLVSRGPKDGFLERTVTIKHHSFVQRTYFSGGGTYRRLFDRYSYHGLTLDRYWRDYYYPAAFYAWVASNWDASVQADWPWVGSPWYQMYAVYFTPYGMYYNGYSWLTDYYLGQMMAEAYLEQAALPDQDTSDTTAPVEADQSQQDTLSADIDTPIGQDVRSAIAGEVQQQLVNDSADTSGEEPPRVGELPADLTPNYIFVVASGIDVNTADQHSCGLSPGDVLRLTAAPDSNAATADLAVVAGKRGDCPTNTHVIVALQDLQDMMNNMRAQIDSGLQELRARQGRTGFPAAPQTALAAPRAAFTDDSPAAADDVAALLATQQGQATRAESVVVQQAFPQ